MSPKEENSTKKTRSKTPFSNRKHSSGHCGTGMDFYKSKKIKQDLLEIVPNKD